MSTTRYWDEDLRRFVTAELCWDGRSWPEQPAWAQKEKVEPAPYARYGELVSQKEIRGKANADKGWKSPWDSAKRKKRCVDRTRRRRCNRCPGMLSVAETKIGLAACRACRAKRAKEAA